jgi:hypothetical protein
LLATTAKFSPHFLDATFPSRKVLIYGHARRNQAVAPRWTAIKNRARKFHLTNRELPERQLKRFQAEIPAKQEATLFRRVLA